MVWRYGESELRCVSSFNSLPFASLCFDKAPARPPDSAVRRLRRATNGLAVAITAGTLCRRVRRLSPEPRKKGTSLSYVAPRANLLRISPLTSATVLFILVVTRVCIQTAHAQNKGSTPKTKQAASSFFCNLPIIKGRTAMVFPKKPLLYAVIGIVLLYIWGLPGWVSVGFGMVGFLVAGGLNYCKLVVRTLPRDLK